MKYMCMILMFVVTFFLSGCLEDEAKEDPHELKTVEFWVNNPEVRRKYNQDFCHDEGDKTPSNCRVIKAIDLSGSKIGQIIYEDIIAENNATKNKVN